MTLQVGDQAPNFTATDVRGRVIELDAARGQPVLLSFYRSASCKLCNLRLWYLQQQFPTLAAQGLRLIGVFETSPATTLEYAKNVLELFPVIADPHMRIFKQYRAKRRSLVGFVRAHLQRTSEYAEAGRRGLGRLSDGHLAQLPADFLLTPDLRIATAHYGHDIGDHLPFAAITEFAAHYAVAQ